MKLEYSMTDTQEELFFDNDARIKVIPKGRRFGFTQGASYYILDSIVTERLPYYLWGDVGYGNIQRYFERYWMPLLKRHKIGYKFNKSIWQLSFDRIPSVVDFRSAEHPASWEGFGYNKTILNEAGIILKNNYIWDNCVRIMMLDYPDAEMIIGGTPKGSGGLYERLWNKTFTDKHFFGKTYTTYDNPLLNHEDIELLKFDIPSSVVRQEIYGEFIKPEGSIINPLWIKYKEPPNACTYKMYVDLAIGKKTTADFFAIVVMAKDKDDIIYVVDAYRDRLSFHNQYKTIVKYSEKWGRCEVGIESTQYQGAMADELFRTTNLNIKEMFPYNDKVTRFYPFSAKVERNLCFFSDKLPPYFFKQLFAFPTDVTKIKSNDEDDKHDDLSDCCSGVCDMHFTNKGLTIRTSGDWN